MVAIVTPFKDGAVDEEALGKLVEYHAAEGTDGIVPCGTTGESATLSHKEHEQVIKVVLEAAAGKMKVLAGTGSNNTEEAIKLTRFAKQAGADGALLITPYYNKPMPEGLFRHFEAIASAVDIPLVLYNVPGRTSLNMLPETVARCAEIPNVVGIKEATASLTQVSKVIDLCGPDFAVLSGDDFTVLPLLAVGGVGVISVTANIVPGDMKGMIQAFQKGDLETARKLHFKMWPINEAMFMETNPIPVKAAVALQGKIGEEIRLPLSPISDANRQKLKKIMAAYGLL
jgi:4-hydroxy-tetrahydrodipicolinate synthase